MRWPFSDGGKSSYYMMKVIIGIPYNSERDERRKYIISMPRKLLNFFSLPVQCAHLNKPFVFVDLEVRRALARVNELLSGSRFARAMNERDPRQMISHANRSCDNFLVH